MTSRLVRLIAYSLCAGLLAGAANAADPEWLGLIPASISVGGLNVERLRASQLGQTIFSALENGAKKSEDASTHATMEILRGTREVILAVRVVGPPTRVLVLLSGSFKFADLQTIARTIRLSSAAVGNVTVFTEGADFSVALVDGSLIVAGDPQTVRDAVEGRGPAERLDPAMAAKVRTLRSSYDYWQLFNASLSPLTLWALGGPSSELLRSHLAKSVREIRGGITFGPRLLVAFEVVAGNGQDAIAIEKAIRMARLENAIPGLSAELIASLVQSLDLRAEGDTVKIGLEIPEAELVKLISSGAEARQTPTNTDVVIQSEPENSGAQVSPSSGDTTVVTLPAPWPR